MAKKKEIKEGEVVVEETPVEEASLLVLPIAEAFGSGDLNILRDKINEVISIINS